MREINIVIAVTKEKLEVVGAFSDRETAIELFKTLKQKGVPVSVHAVEMNTYREFIQEFDLGE